ncbi:hypothetical protein GUI12_00765 [Anaplasmataceae bacterium AB001_6]|nr:hypothetical protein GUI12_00765 [Anaplasmataceae bacterium AB001_6]
MFKNKYIRRRLYIFTITAIVISLLFYMLITLLSKNISFFYTTTEALEYIRNQSSSQDNYIKDFNKQIGIQSSKSMRISGFVVENSTEKINGKISKFDISDGTTTMTVNYTGTLPPIFREGLQIIAKGYIDSKDERYVIEAQQILGKHDERYIPKSKYQKHGDSHGI